MPASSPIRRSVLLGIALLYQAPGHAQVPSGGTVVGGIAHINQPDATHQVINQVTPKAIINWRDFSIGSGSQVRFNQPSSSSVILNRVTGANPSNINGSLSANGQVFLVNPQGVYFGAGASVDVAGLLATTLNIGNDDFLAGRYLFTRDLLSSDRREVINAGILKAREGGYVVLAGDYAANNGVIQARLGTAALASGSKMTLDINGDNLVNFTVNEKTVAQLSGVENSGQLLADGGRAIMTAAVANQLATSAVNNTGLVQARSVEQRNGAIYLGSDGGDMQLSGTLDASGTGAGQTGGTIDVTGNNVVLQDAARLDVSGDAGGGKAQVGGGFQGKGSLANAQTVSVAGGARIKADALGNGNGGDVVIWSDQHTAYAGNISAQGGAQGGDGGNVEVSGKLLDYSGKVSTLAAHGNTGNLLLDPIDIRVLNPGLIVTPTPSGVSQMTVGDLETALNANNVTLQTSLGSGAPNGGTITIDDGSGGGVQWNAATTLKLQANNSIAINSTVEGYNGTLWLDAPNGATQKGGTVIGANSLLLTGGGNWDLAGVGSSSAINSHNNVNTLAANLSGGGLLQFSNSKNLTIGSVGGVNGLSHASGTTWFYLDQNNGALNLAQDVSSNTLYLRASGGTTQTGGKISAGNLALVGGAATLNRSGNHVGNLMASINGALSYTDSGAINIGSIYGINGITTSNHNVTLVTGDASGYDNTKPPDGTNPASLTLNQGINAGTGAISLTAGTGGAYQAHAADSDGKPLTAGALTGGSLLLRGSSSAKVTPFILNNANNRIGTLAASLNGSLSYTGGPLTVGSVGGVNGITTTSNTVVVAASTDSSGRATPAVYNDNNVSLSIGGDLSINQNIDAATSTGSGSVSIGMGGDFTAATGSGVRINANTLGVFGDDLQGRFTLTTNVSSLAAAGGKVMVIDNSAYTGDLTGLGIGAPAANASGTNDNGTVSVDSASKPVGDFYLTTGGGLNVIKLISKGDNLMLRANSLNILLDASTADNAHIMLQPYDLSRSIGINNSNENGYSDTYATNYSADLLNKFTNPTATFYFGTPQNAILNDSDVISAANNTQTGDIHIGYDGGFDLGYRSLSAQTSGNLVAYNVGPLYNLRLAAPNLTIYGFNTFGDQIHLFSNNLQLPSSGDKYVNPNKPTITLRSLKDETIWVGNVPDSAARSGETSIKSTVIQKLPDWSTVVISGSTDYPFPSGGPGYGDIHIPWDDGYGDRLGHRTLVLSTGHNVYHYTGSPAYTQKSDGGTSGGLWKGCQNLSTCQGTNPDPYSSSTGGGSGSDGSNSDTGNTGNSGNSNSGDCPTCSPAPPNKNPFPPDTTPTGGGNGNNGSGDGSSSNGASSTGGGDGGAGADSGGAGDGGAGSGGSGAGDGGGGAGATGDGGGDGGAGAGSGGAGDGANGNGAGDGGAGSGTTGSGGGDGGAGTGSGGAGDGGNGAGNGGAGNGAGGAGANGDGAGGAGDGTGGAGNGGAGDGSGAGGAGGGDGGAGTGSGGAGDGAGDGGAGAGAGGAGDGSGGNGSGGAGSGATGAGGGDGGAGTGSGGAGDGANGNGAGGGAGDGGAANGGAGAGGNGAGNGDGGAGTGAGGAGNGANGNGGGDGGAGTGDGGNGNGGNGGGANGAGAGNGGAGNGADGAGGGDGGAGTGGGGAGGDAGGSANDGANTAGAGAGGAGDGNGGNGAGDGGAGGGDGGAGTGSGGAGSNGDGAGGGDAGAGSGGAGNGRNGGAADTGDGNGGNGSGGDGSGGGDAGAGTGDGGAGDGGAGAADGGAGNGNGGRDGSNGNTGSPDTGKGGGGGTADEAGGGDSGAGTGDGGTTSGNHGNGDNGAGRNGGNQNANGANSNGGAGNGEAGNGGNGGNQSANGGDGSGDRNAAAPSSPAVDLSCDAVVNAKTPPPEDTDQASRQQLLAIKGDGVKLGNPCQKQPEPAGKGN